MWKVSTQVFGEHNSNWFHTKVNLLYVKFSINISKAEKTTFSSWVYKQSNRRARSSARNACLRRMLTESALGGFAWGGDSSISRLLVLPLSCKVILASFSPMVGSLTSYSTTTPSVAAPWSISVKWMCEHTLVFNPVITKLVVRHLCHTNTPGGSNE